MNEEEARLRKQLDEQQTAMRQQLQREEEDRRRQLESEEAARRAAWAEEDRKREEEARRRQWDEQTRLEEQRKAEEARRLQEEQIRLQHEEQERIRQQQLQAQWAAEEEAKRQWQAQQQAQQQWQAQQQQQYYQTTQQTHVQYYGAHPQQAVQQAAMVAPQVVPQMHQQQYMQVQHQTTVQRGVIPRVCVTVAEARGLRGSDFLGSSPDPYAVVQLREVRYQTRKERSTRTPVWHQEFEFTNFGPQDQLTIGLWDKDRFSHDDFLGQVVLRYEDLTDGCRRWWGLQSRPGVGDRNIAGEVYVHIRLPL
jgi:hypothetical protein